MYRNLDAGTMSMPRCPGAHAGDGGAGPPPPPSRDLLVASARGDDPLLHAVRHHSTDHSLPGEQRVLTGGNGGATVPGRA